MCSDPLSCPRACPTATKTERSRASKASRAASALCRWSRLVMVTPWLSAKPWGPCRRAERFCGASGASATSRYSSLLKLTEGNSMLKTGSFPGDGESLIPVGVGICEVLIWFGGCGACGGWGGIKAGAFSWSSSTPVASTYDVGSNVRFEGIATSILTEGDLCTSWLSDRPRCGCEEAFDACEGDSLAPE